MAMYEVTVKVLRRNGKMYPTLRMRSSDEEHPYQLYTRAVRRLYGRNCWFHSTSTDHKNIGRVAWPCACGMGIDLGDRIRIDTALVDTR